VAYWLCLQFHAHYLVANAAGWISGVLVGFSLNRTMTFEVRDSRAWRSQLAMFLAGAIAQLALSSLGLTLLVGHLGLGPLVAFVINTVVLATLNFLWLHVVFARRE